MHLIVGQSCTRILHGIGVQRLIVIRVAELATTDTLFPTGTNHVGIADGTAVIIHHTGTYQTSILGVDIHRYVLEVHLGIAIGNCSTTCISIIAS